MYFLGRKKQKRFSGSAAGDRGRAEARGAAHQLRCWAPPCRACRSWTCLRSAFFSSSTVAFCTTTTAAEGTAPSAPLRPADTPQHPPTDTEPGP